MKSPVEKQIIGRLEKVDFPDLDLIDIDAKIDTGAYTSALHCHDINETSDGQLAFKLLDPDHPNYNEKVLLFKQFSKTTVRSSNGTPEMRYKIKSRIRIAQRVVMAEFTLTDRRAMKYPVLIGRKLISGRFLVDVKKRFTATERKLK
ncbi:MAG: ATP-dependent zinc protease [Calditrichaeota bacterium]|nr:ATP-dependent zinc protease [Calditrichota bacterium]